MNSTHPGQIEDTALFRNASPALAQSLRASIPMQRAGKPSKCADLALFLACDESAFITGVEIPIGGGYSSGSTMWMRQHSGQNLWRPFRILPALALAPDAHRGSSAGCAGYSENPRGAKGCGSGPAN